MSKSNWLSKVLANLGTSNDANGNVEVDPASVEYVHKLISAQLIRERLKGNSQALKSIIDRGNSVSLLMPFDDPSFKIFWGELLEAYANSEKRLADLTNKLKKVEDE